MDWQVRLTAANCKHSIGQFEALGLAANAFSRFKLGAGALVEVTCTEMFT